MALATAIPTPRRAGLSRRPDYSSPVRWPYLLVYYIVAAIIVFLLARRLGIARFSRSHRERAIAAVILAAIFAPGEVTDFFLFILPGPAVVGLLCLLLGCPDRGRSASCVVGRTLLRTHGRDYRRLLHPAPAPSILCRIRSTFSARSFLWRHHAKRLTMRWS